MKVNVWIQFRKPCDLCPNVIEKYLCISVYIFKTPLNIKVKTFTDRT